MFYLHNCRFPATIILHAAEYVLDYMDVPLSDVKPFLVNQDPMCIICRYYLHLSAVVCSCRPAKAVCLQV